MTFPVPWIEQSVYYQNLETLYNQYVSANTTVVVHSFTEPTQSMWENAYLAQTGQSVPIQPGSRLHWFDLKNGNVKPYTTVWGPNGVDIDAQVRPLINEVDPQGCLRYLGRKRLAGGTLFYGQNTDIRYDAYGIFFDLQYLIEKNLVALIVQYKALTPVLISLQGPSSGAWGRIDQSFGYSLERAAATATSTFRVVGGGSTPHQDVYYTLASYNSGTPTTVTTETNFGYGLIFSPAAAAGQPMQSGTSYIGLAAALTAQATPLRLWQTYGVKYDGSGVRDLRQITGTGTLTNEYSNLYGLFADDPGYIEVFSV